MSQATARSELSPLQAGPGAQSRWHKAPILIQQRSNPEPGEMGGLPAKPADTNRCPPRSNQLQRCKRLQEAYLARQEHTCLGCEDVSIETTELIYYMTCP